MSPVEEEFQDYVARLPLELTAELWRGLEGSEAYLSPTGLFEKVRAAVRDKRPFAHVRGGDGEGAFVIQSPEVEARYAALFAAVRADRARVWFADEIDLVESGFIRQALRFKKDVLAKADVIGVPPLRRLLQEYDIRSPCGVVGLTNLLEAVLELAGSARALVCRGSAHIELFDEGLLPSLLSEQPRIGVISCHVGLPAVLQTRFGAPQVDFHRIPGEKLMADKLSASALEGQHFPDTFMATLHALDRPLGGMVFLVAGGLLGKFYCARIKQSGGVVIDIGSLADVWMGANTR